MSSILKVISLPPEWFELLLHELEDELSRCKGCSCGFCFLRSLLLLLLVLAVAFCGIEYMGRTPRLVPGSGPTAAAAAPVRLLPNVLSLGAGNRGGDTGKDLPGTDLDSTSGRLDGGAGAPAN